MKDYFIGKKIVILGFGKEGKSTYEYIRKYVKDLPLTVMDQNYQNITLEDENVQLIDVNYDILSIYDLIFKTPGISLKDVDVTPFKDKITSQLELLLEQNKGFIIGITGSKGKSTTSSLIYKIINDQGYKTFLLGNIGNPILDNIDDIDEDTYVVVEMSSHQLEFVKSSPNIAIILNLFPEHLDHYQSLDAYYKAKLNIAKFQSKDDYFLYSSDNKDLDRYKDYIQTDAKKIDINFTKKDNSYTYLNEDNVIVNDRIVYDKNEEVNIKGNHNLKDIMFALTVANILNLDNERVIKSIKEYKPLEHRMELVGTYNDITYYNDSIATIPEATINAIMALEKVDTLIVGGMDRHINYDEFIEFLKKDNLRNIICMPDTGNYIYEKVKDYKNAILVKTIEEAVDTAKKITKKGSICLLSPAASSYGFYKNFEERGNRFKEHVKKI